MDWLTVAILVLFVLFILFRVLPPRGVKRVSAAQLEETMKGSKSMQIIDVREADEYRSGHIHGARNIPLGQVKSAAGGIRKDKETYLVCASGFRSGQAARILKKEGFNNLHNVSGGMKQWKGKVVKK